MNIDRLYGNVAPYLVYSELMAAVKRRGGKLDEDHSYIRTSPGGRFRGEIVACFATQVRRTVNSGRFGTREVVGDELVPAFNARVVGQTYKCRLTIEARDDIIGRGRLTRIEEDLKQAVGSWGATERYSATK